MAITSKRVNWILDADIEGFLDAIDHEWLIKFLEHRIGDGRILRLIRKWPGTDARRWSAGVSEDGEWSRTRVGTPPTHLQCVPGGDFAVTCERVSTLCI